MVKSIEPAYLSSDPPLSGWRTDDVLVVADGSDCVRRRLAAQVKRPFPVSECSTNFQKNTEFMQREPE